MTSFFSSPSSSSSSSPSSTSSSSNHKCREEGEAEVGGGREGGGGEEEFSVFFPPSQAFPSPWLDRLAARDNLGIPLQICRPIYDFSGEGDKYWKEGCRPIGEDVFGKGLFDPHCNACSQLGGRVVKKPTTAASAATTQKGGRKTIVTAWSRPSSSIAARRRRLQRRRRRRHDDDDGNVLQLPQLQSETPWKEKSPRLADDDYYRCMLSDQYKWSQPNCTQQWDKWTDTAGLTQCCKGWLDDKGAKKGGFPAAEAYEVPIQPNGFGDYDTPSIPYPATSLARYLLRCKPSWNPSSSSSECNYVMGGLTTTPDSQDTGFCGELLQNEDDETGAAALCPMSTMRPGQRIPVCPRLMAGEKEEEQEQEEEPPSLPPPPENESKRVPILTGSSSSSSLAVGIRPWEACHEWCRTHPETCANTWERICSLDPPGKIPWEACMRYVQREKPVWHAKVASRICRYDPYPNTEFCRQQAQGIVTPGDVMQMEERLRPFSQAQNSIRNGLASLLVTINMVVAIAMIILVIVSTAAAAASAHYYSYSSSSHSLSRQRGRKKK